MKLNKYNPMLISYFKEEVPHCVIEVNQKCNIACKACYKNLSDYTKSLKQIQQEIDFVLSKRNVRSITLAGGEPTLHPQLTEVIRAIAVKGIDVQILTNGFGLSFEKFREYKTAGLTDVFLHIDSLQTRTDAKVITREKDLDALREEIGQDVVKAGLRCSLAVTLYQKNLAELDDIVSFILKSKNFHRMLVTNYTDFRKFAPYYNQGINNFDERQLDDQIVKNEEVEKFLSEKMEMRPFAYIGSSQSKDERRWIYYYAYSIYKKNGDIKILKLSPSFKKVVSFLSQLAKCKNQSMPLRGPKIMEKSRLMLLLYAVFSMDLKVLCDSLKFLLQACMPGSIINRKRFVFQQGPNLKPNGTIEYCHNCPDATVRDGVLTPLCIVDLIDTGKHIQL